MIERDTFSLRMLSAVSQKTPVEEYILNNTWTAQTGHYG